MPYSHFRPKTETIKIPFTNNQALTPHEESFLQFSDNVKSSLLVGTASGATELAKSPGLGPNTHLSGENVLSIIEQNPVETEILPANIELSRNPTNELVSNTSGIKHTLHSHELINEDNQFRAGEVKLQSSMPNDAELHALLQAEANSCLELDGPESPHNGQANQVLMFSLN
jgi:hypothetical protein